MSIRYVHTNLVAHNWKKLADFYISVFNCRRIPPERNLQGDWLDKGTGVKNAAIQGIHLLLPGYDENGPTLEIFQYGNNTSKPTPAANQVGFSHIAFSVDNVEETLEKILQHGGSGVGEIAQKRLIERLITFVYATDPEGNIIEIQNWKDL
jgi:predicted enzyme related to lactoylglutathione lyase